MGDVMDGSSEGSDEYVDGSIYRVKLHNFLTYSDAEFYPGPRLNLILGPNGTGKSSIVCALCVGLAGSTKFVRHEKESGYTEIELFFERGNKVIRRNIFRDNKSTWQVNGKDSTLKHVAGIMEAASIQIDNLCQFLPQDKVGEFSRMNAVQLLKATENAITDSDLATKHEEIIELQHSMSDKGRELEHARAALELKKSENAQRQKEVERIEDYEARIEETAVMEKKCLWLEFEKAKAEVEELKEEKLRCKEAINKERKEKIDPLVELLKKEQIKLEDVKAEYAMNFYSAVATISVLTTCVRVKTRKTEVDGEKKELVESIRKEKKHIENMEGAQSQTLSDVKELRNQHNSTRRKLERLERDVADWHKEREGMANDDDLREQKEQLERQQRAKDMEETEIRSKREALSRELSYIDSERRKVTSKLEKLDNEDVQRRLALQRADPDCIRAADWVKSNQHRLKRKVWGPIALEMKLNETMHAKYVEDTLPKWLLGALVAESYEDYNTILREVNNVDSDRRIKASIVIVENGTCHAVHRPYSPGQMDDYCQRYGMKGFLDELVAAPDIVHEALRAHGGLHTVMVGSQQTEDIINRGGQIFNDIASSERKSAFVTPYKKYVTSVSKYGNRNVTTRTNDLLNPRLLAASTSNEDEKAEMKKILDDLEARERRIQVEITDLKEQEKQYAEEKRKAQHRITEIRSQRKAIIRLDDKITEGDNKIYSLKSELAQDVSSKEEALTRKLKNQASKQAQQIKHCLELSRKLFKTSAREVCLSLQLGTQQVRVEFTQKHLKQTETTLRNLKEAHKLAKDNLLTVARRAMDVKRKAEEEAPWDDYEKRFSQLPDDLDELLGKIENNKAALECFRGDRTIRELYERVRDEIRDDEVHLADLESFVTDGEDKINGIKGKWHADLKDVVEHIDTSFREFFKDIGCVGEILLDDEDPDVAKWGIQRRAQFRKNTKLSTMTAEEQSGGEKSVGTIMYLMALQSLTKCPFRVVDEINQGMDVYNERKVFQRITKSSCGSKLPQYFLITPKLITGLNYHRDTKVMVILNGPYNNIQQELWDPDRFVACGKQGKRKGDGAVNGSSKKRIRA
ncbi:structural maintenance of chromosomes protein 5, putative [Phytophthora infestans T30-4]|uniref:Structural maintenance of chromosomes protein 5 n=1 Tax=Phytophthora infestans (strain T30-4) TaxID=403677 RepID=D0MX49_PHYIT|nr:structural maintenance of chromosomes protein 5, putative [Phytophthora infestans T30-4]EEY64212.1 structural maintenance of chromosomes protein 5, putative [Phytophthora infestans T30-4]|eukprot:XP_002907648.1 structural maintenance of chromosomes protein 5, putative [Phytophthora infestans T30-4]